jgi:hypothetical protein
MAIRETSVKRQLRSMVRASPFAKAGKDEKNEDYGLLCLSSEVFHFKLSVLKKKLPSGRTVEEVLTLQANRDICSPGNETNALLIMIGNYARHIVIEGDGLKAWADIMYQRSKFGDRMYKGGPRHEYENPISVLDVLGYKDRESSIRFLLNVVSKFTRCDLKGMCGGTYVLKRGQHPPSVIFSWEHMIYNNHYRQYLE